MTGWDDFNLEKLVQIKHGFAFKGEFFSDEPTNDILLTPGNFSIGGGFKGDKLKYYAGLVPSDYVLKEGDLIVTMTDLSKEADTLGFAAKVPKMDSKRFLHNQRIGLVTLIDDKVDIGFIYWQMRTYSYQRYVAGSATGATVKHTSPTKIRSYKFTAPKSIITQRKIASILSAYDDLIENNFKRIRLLEELAQRTYEEWFVKFRVKGEELKVDKETGLPEGWEKKRLRDILELNYGKALKSDERISGNFPVFGSSGIIGSHTDFLVKGPGIIVGRKGNVGSVFWSEDNFYPIDTVYFVSSNTSLYFLYYNLKKQNFINNDAAVPGLNRNAAYMAESFLPTEEMLDMFSVTVKPIFDSKENLEKQNRLLKEARDILLPRLMSGKIEL